jgi:hypothetical protein
MDVPAKIRTRDENHLVATWDRVLLAIWHLHPLADAIAALNRTAVAFLEERSTPSSMVMIIEPQSPTPGHDGRAELVRLTKDIIPRMATGIVVAEGGGFRTATVRSVATALTVLAPHKVPLKFAGTVDEAAALVAPHLSRDVDANAFRRAVAELRARPA